MIIADHPFKHMSIYAASLFIPSVTTTSDRCRCYIGTPFRHR